MRHKHFLVEQLLNGASAPTGNVNINIYIYNKINKNKIELNI